VWPPTGIGGRHVGITRTRRTRTRCRTVASERSVTGRRNRRRVSTERSAPCEYVTGGLRDLQHFGNGASQQQQSDCLIQYAVKRQTNGDEHVCERSGCSTCRVGDSVRSHVGLNRSAVVPVFVCCPDRRVVQTVNVRAPALLGPVDFFQSPALRIGRVLWPLSTASCRPPPTRHNANR